MTTSRPTATTQMRVPSHSRLSLYDHQQAYSNHTDESGGKPSYAPGGMFTLDALPGPNLPISGLEDWFRIC